MKCILCEHGDAFHRYSGWNGSGKPCSIQGCRCKDGIYSFEDYYWKIYLPAHKKPLTKLIHMAGLLATLAFIMLCGTNGWWLLLLLAPFVVYPFAWSSHLLIEKNKPAAFKNPIYAKLADMRMFADVTIGAIELNETGRRA